jgi:hypothetical protein
LVLGPQRGYALADAFSGPAKERHLRVPIGAAPERSLRIWLALRHADAQSSRRPGCGGTRPELPGLRSGGRVASAHRCAHNPRRSGHPNRQSGTPAGWRMSSRLTRTSDHASAQHWTAAQRLGHRRLLRCQGSADVPHVLVAGGETREPELKRHLSARPNDERAGPVSDPRPPRVVGERPRLRTSAIASMAEVSATAEQLTRGLSEMSGRARGLLGPRRRSSNGNGSRGDDERPGFQEPGPITGRRSARSCRNSARTGAVGLRARPRPAEAESDR